MRLEQANILSSHNHSSLATARSEDVALSDNLGRRTLQRFKRWSSLKHYMRSVGMKENTLQSKGKGALKPKDLR